MKLPNQSQPIVHNTSTNFLNKSIFPSTFQNVCVPYQYPIVDGGGFIVGWTKIRTCFAVWVPD